MGTTCPCGLGDDYDACCGRLHAGAAALTAESLMRSRYSAFAVGDAAYLLRTWHRSTRLPRISSRSGLGLRAPFRCACPFCPKCRSSFPPRALSRRIFL